MILYLQSPIIQSVLGGGGGVVVIPDEPVQIRDAALEIAALLSLKDDYEFISIDPLIETEINELLSVGRRFLEISLNRLTSQRPTSSKWYFNGKQQEVSWFRPASFAASEFMDEKYPSTPEIINQQMVRQKLSRQMQTNRVRLITRLMEHAEIPLLGFDESDGSAEASIYRTILSHTGLHKLDKNGRGCFAKPNELNDKGMREVWGIIEKFFSEKGKKKLKDLVEELSSEPYGLASGVMPIIVMAGYKAFGRCVSIYSNGNFVNDILGFESVRMFENPHEHEFVIHESDRKTLEYLSALSQIFFQKEPGKYEEHIRFTDDCMQKWKVTVAEGARRAKRLSREARDLLRMIGDADNPAKLFLEDIPNLFANQQDFNSVVGEVKKCRRSIDDLITGYIRDAIDEIRSALSLQVDDNTLENLKCWLNCFDTQSLLQRKDLRLTDKAVLKEALKSRNGVHTDETLARAFSSILLQRGLEKWQDDTATQLRKELRECRQRIEDAALDDERPSENLKPIIESRIELLNRKLGLIDKNRKGKRK